MSDNTISVSYEQLIETLERGGCLAKQQWPGRWMWLWHETTSTGYTRWRRYGFASKVETVDALADGMKRCPAQWIVVQEN